MIISSALLPVPPPRDRLGVLTTTLPVVLASPQVILNGPQIAAIAAEWATTPWPADTWDTSLHFFDGTTRTLNWMALLDALNFCFWAEPGQPRWRVHWHDTWLDGYAALAAALSRNPSWDAADFAEMSESWLAHIFRPGEDEDGNPLIPLAPTPTPEASPADIFRWGPVLRPIGQHHPKDDVLIPLFDERLANVRELGQTLLDRFAGEFACVIDEAEGDAVELALLIADAFPSFHDVATWNGQEVRLLKRAQILVGDIATAFAGTSWGTFANLGDLTAFADYKVPQLLRRLRMLNYAPKLAAHIDQLKEIPAGSTDEVAIRAATVWGVELLRRELAARGVDVTAAAIDHRLWQAGQTAHADDRPYHRTRTIFY